MTLIRAYGEYWRKETLDRLPGKERGRGRLPGITKIRGRRVEVDVWGQRGIYVLLSDFKPVYVGKTSERSLGTRLKEHLTDRHAGRWDMFSWYGVRGFTRQRGQFTEPGKFKRGDYREDSLIKTLEAFGIAITDPLLNQKKQNIPGAAYVSPRKLEPELGLTERDQLRAVYDYVKNQTGAESRRQLRSAKKQKKTDRLLRSVYDSVKKLKKRGASDGQMHTRRGRIHHRRRRG